jgi:hypothetical protein
MRLGRAGPAAGLAGRREVLDLDLEADLHDLGGRNSKICRRKIGVEMHRGEQ